MGSPIHEHGCQPGEDQHYVCLCRGFYMTTTAVRVSDFRAFIESSGYLTEAEREGWSYGYRDEKWGRHEGLSWRTPGFSQGLSHPVVCVSWNDATAYCVWLSDLEGRHYRLPTESEWEYSCRSGSVGSYQGR